MWQEKNLIRVISERTLDHDSEGKEVFVTQYSNDKYWVFLREEKEKTEALIMRADVRYPQIHTDGIEIRYNGVFGLEDISKKLKYIETAKETLEQVLALKEGILVK